MTYRTTPRWRLLYPVPTTGKFAGCEEYGSQRSGDWLWWSPIQPRKITCQLEGVVQGEERALLELQHARSANGILPAEDCK